MRGLLKKLNPIRLLKKANPVPLIEKGVDKAMKEIVLGLVRHVLTFAGGAVVTGGLLTDLQYAEAAAAVVTLVAAIWSMVKNWKAFRAARRQP